MNLRSNTFGLVIEEFDSLNNRHIAPKDIIDCIKENEVFDFYALILHDLDVDEYGVLKHKHYHLVVKLGASYTKTTLINYFSKLLMIQKTCIQCRVVELVQAVQYLTHKGIQDKHEYDVLDIYSSDYESLLTILDKGINYFELDIDYLIKVVNDSSSIVSVYSQLGLKVSKLYYSIINSMWKEIKEKYHEKE